MRGLRGHSPLGDTRAQEGHSQGLHPSRGHRWPGERVLWGHQTGGCIPQRVTSPRVGEYVLSVPKGRRASPFFGDTLLGVVSLRGANMAKGTALEKSLTPGDTGSLHPRVPCASPEGACVG